MAMLSAKVFTLGIAGLGLSACVSVLPEPEAPDALYRIEAAEVRHHLPADLLVRALESPQIGAGQAIISEDATGAIRLVPGVEWAGRSTRLMQLAIVDSFAPDRAGTAILSASGLRADYELIGRVQRFALVEDQAVCEMHVLLATVPAATVLETAEVKTAVPVNSRRAADRANAMKQAAEQCVVKIADFAATSLANQLEQTIED